MDNSTFKWLKTQKEKINTEYIFLPKYCNIDLLTRIPSSVRQRTFQNVKFLTMTKKNLQFRSQYYSGRCSKLLFQLIRDWRGALSATFFNARSPCGS